MRSPIVTALVQPLNLFMLAAAIVAGLISAWWMFPLGLFLWLIMVIVVARDPALRLNVDKDRRDTLAQRFQDYFSRVERSQVSVFNSLSNAPSPVRRAMQPVQDELETLVDRTYAFCQRMTNLDNYRMVAESQRNLDQDLKRVEEALSRAQDPIIRQEYEESKKSLAARLGDRLALVRQLDRVEAQLLDQLGQVTVALRHIGTHDPIPFWMMGSGAGLVTPLGGTDFDFDHRLPHQAPPVERPHGQQRDHGIAARAAGILSVGQLLAV